MNHSLSRRQLLAALGVGAAMVPLSSFRKSAQGANPPFPTRLVIVTSSNGINAHSLWPTIGPLAPLTQAQFPNVLAPLWDMRAQLLVPMNMQHAAGENDPLVLGDPGHRAYFTLLSGIASIGSGGVPSGAGGPSIDQYIARALRDGGSQTPVSSLELGCWTLNQPVHRAVWQGKNNALPAQSSPSTLFKDFFSGGADVATLRQRRRSVLDATHKNLENYAKRFGGDDRVLIDGHLSSLRQLELELDPKNAAAASCTLPNGIEEFSQSDSNNYDKIGRKQVELITLAMKCGLTRVATLQFGDSNMADFHFPPQNSFLPEAAGRDAHFEIGHAGSFDAAPPPTTERAQTADYLAKTAFDRWHLARFGDLVRNFAATPEGDGTMLDHSVLMYINQFGIGGAHNLSPLKMVLAGSCNGYFKTGRAFDAKGAPLNKVFVSLCQAMGLSNNTFGSSAFGEGPLGALST
jgi:Protein of unknown function (DUF1552)